MRRLFHGNLISDPAEWAVQRFQRTRDYRAFQIGTVCFGVLNCAVVWLCARLVPIPFSEVAPMFGAVFLLTSVLPLGYLHAIRALVLDRSKQATTSGSEPAA
jgi:hypothetical protein